MKDTFLKVFLLVAMVVLLPGKTIFAIGGSVSHGNISVYKNGDLADQLSGVSPVEDGALLVCYGKCMVKSVGISLLPSDRSQISVTNMSDSYNLFVRQGWVDFAISSNKRKIAFFTEKGRYTVAEAVMDSEGYSTVKGRFGVDDEGRPDISITEGEMDFEIDKALEAVDEDNTLAMAINPGTEVTQASSLKTASLAAGGFLTTVIGLQAIDNDISSEPVIVPVPPTTPDYDDDTTASRSN